MFFSSLQAATHWIIQNGYLLMFIIMLIEGPVITAAGAFGAALGFCNIWIVLILSILGNLIPDIVYYALGYWGRERFVDKYGRYFGLSHAKMISLENRIKNNEIKSILAIKLIPLLATPGLIVLGLTKMDLKKFATWCLIITIPSSLFYLIVGYYFGAAYDIIAHYVRIGGYLILFFVAALAFVMYLWGKAKQWFTGRIEK